MTSKSVSVTTFQYLVCPPFLSMTKPRHGGYQRFAVLLVMSVTQTSLTAYLRFSALGGCLYTTISFTVSRLDWNLGSSRVIPAQISCFYSGTLGHLWSMTRNAILHEDHAAMDVRAPSLWTIPHIRVHSQCLWAQWNTDQQRHGTTWHPKSFGSARISLWLQHTSCQ